MRDCIFNRKLSQSIALHFMAHDALHKSFYIFLRSPLLEGGSAFPHLQVKGQSLTQLPFSPFLSVTLLCSLLYPARRGRGVLLIPPNFVLGYLVIRLPVRLVQWKNCSGIKTCGREQSEHFSPSVSMGTRLQQWLYILHVSSFHEVTPTPVFPLWYSSIVMSPVVANT